MSLGSSEDEDSYKGLVTFSNMEPTNAEEASAEAVHKAKNAAQAIELARQAQQAELVEQTAQKTKEALMEGLKEVFKDESGEDSNVIVRWKRIPFLCKSVEEMHQSLEKQAINTTWLIRGMLGLYALVGGAIIAVLTSFH